jgi:transcriptional regulator with GAF, ATPase, and Fis domain
MTPGDHHTPRGKLARAARYRLSASKLEREAIREALEVARGVSAYAADLLGVPRQTMKDWLRRQHSDLAEEARQMRENAGYKGGKPPKELKVG